MGRENPALLKTSGLVKTYPSSDGEITILDHIDFEASEGNFIAIVGRSGSGKTTFLNMLAGLDAPTKGSVTINGQNLSNMSDAELTQLRRHTVGFVFQSFGLLPLLSAYENVELPLRIAGYSVKDRSSLTMEALEIVGLEKRKSHRPYELSGGEQKRVSIARAIVVKPPLILADEPTGELDSNNSKSIFGLFREVVTEQKITIITVTHDSTLLSMADDVKELNNGKLQSIKTEGQRFR
jgi:ABC-type lipoprotein export system ATPase subunit|tara:strand:+ start:444 stop:1157 length:714 start_codon:yes stop_codon:yes gene_type:complete